MIHKSGWELLEARLERFMDKATVWVCLFAVLYTLGHLVFALLRGAL
ncbi:MAG: hypothetical protein ACYC6L_12735 [Anaerolineae bacterium]